VSAGCCWALHAAARKTSAVSRPMRQTLIVPRISPCISRLRSSFFRATRPFRGFTYSLSIACTYSGFSGSRRTIFPVASWSAAAMAGAARAFASEPPPYVPTFGFSKISSLMSRTNVRSSAQRRTGCRRRSASGPSARDSGDVARPVEILQKARDLRWGRNNRAHTLVRAHAG
jgi:hypothetical protein